MSNMSQIQLDVMDSIESLSDCMSKIIALKKDGITAPNCEAVAEHIANVKFQLDELADDLGYKNDVDWWYDRKVRNGKSDGV